WVSERYQLEPDLIVFGKGLQVAGVAIRTGALNSDRIETWRTCTTLENSVEALLRSTVILRSISERKLLPSSREAGKKLLARLRANDSRFRSREPSRGLGLLLWTSLTLEGSLSGRI